MIATNPYLKQLIETVVDEQRPLIVGDGQSVSQQVPQLGYLVGTVMAKIAHFRKDSTSHCLFGILLREESDGEGGKVDPEQQVEGVQAEGTAGGVSNVAVLTKEPLVRKLHPLVVELGLSTNLGAKLCGRSIHHKNSIQCNSPK